MSLSDCPECWETPCVCGHQYRNYHLPTLYKMRDMFQCLIDKKEREIETSERNNK
jgi:hypothetical protein